MAKTEKHMTKKWEVSIMELEGNKGKTFKVTRRIPEISVAETRVFRLKKRAKKQYDGWLK